MDKSKQSATLNFKQFLVLLLGSLVLGLTLAVSKDLTGVILSTLLIATGAVLWLGTTRWARALRTMPQLNVDESPKHRQLGPLNTVQLIILVIGSLIFGFGMTLRNYIHPFFFANGHNTL